jgi:AraC-like DNA-binding protein
VVTSSLRKVATLFNADGYLIKVMEPRRRFRYAHLWAPLTTLFFFACSHSEFQRQHKQALAENPSGVELEIRTRDGRKQFAVSEPVPFEEFYTSTYSGLWHIEILEGWNEASNATSSDVVHLTDGGSVWNQPREGRAGTVCCDSRHVWLSQEQTRIPYQLSPTLMRSNPSRYRNPEWLTLHLPSKPGKYQVYITTERVFRRSDSTTTYNGKGVAVSSNLLTLEVK